MFSSYAGILLTFVNLLRVSMTFCESPARTHEFRESPARTHDLVIFVNLLLVRMISVNVQLVRMNSLDFCESPARTHDLCESPACTHEFCESSGRTNEFCGSSNDLICLIKGSLLSQNFKKGSLARCFSSVFALVTDNQDRLCHLHHMEVIPSQAVSDLHPDLTLSVILECSSVRTSG